EVRREAVEVAVVPAVVQVTVGAPLGEARQHPAVAGGGPGVVAAAEGAGGRTPGGVLSRRPRARATERSRTCLLHVGRIFVAASFARAARDHGSPGSRSDANGALCAHHSMTLGW